MGFSSERGIGGVIQVAMICVGFKDVGFREVLFYLVFV